MTELQPAPMLRIPQIILVDEAIDSALPLEHTLVNVQITGPLATVAIKQRFGNPLRERAELEYLFPLPAEAAITGFSLQIGERTIRGDLQEREAARSAYEDARSKGARAGLFEQRRENLFSVRLANVQPGETIEATLRYQQQLVHEDDPFGGAYEFTFPMGITPKYDSPEHPEEGEGVHAPLAHGEKIGPVEIELAADAGFPMRELSSPTHPIEIVWLDGEPGEGQPGGRRFQVRLAGEHIPDRDFVLRMAPGVDQPRLAGWMSSAAEKDGDVDEGYFLAALLPPAIEDDPQPSPREFIFVLDRSGSMSGEPIRQARNALRACLRVLNPEDRYSILLFDNTLEWFRPEPMPATQETVEQADAFLKQVEGRGGTEIVQALEAALALPVDPQRTRYVVFLTDGAVSAEGRVLERVRPKTGQARLFTFGIGPSVNRALLSRMAALGRGRASFLQVDEDIEGAIIRFQDSISFPALTDLSLHVEGGKVWDVYPSRLPDLYYGQPLAIRGRIAHRRDDTVRLTVSAMRAGRPLQITAELLAPVGRDQAVERLWAQARIDELFEQMALDPRSAEKLRADILGLALEHGLVTALTSFVAVDQQVDAVSGTARVIHVAQPLPQGLNILGFAPHGPIAAAPPVMPGAAGGPVIAAAKMRTFVNPQLSKDAPGDALFSTSGVREGRSLEAASLPADALPEVDSRKSGGEPVLRWLSRTQNMNGSWQGDVEWTAAALLAFIRAGHTTHSGSYRQIVRRAARWLARSSAAGLAEQARVLALNELAAATGNRAGAIAPPEFALSIQPPEAIRTLHDLRHAALLRVKLPVPAELLNGPHAELARVWSAVMQA